MKEKLGRAMTSSISTNLIRRLNLFGAHALNVSNGDPCNATVTHVLSVNSSSVTRTAIHMLPQLALSTFRTSPWLVARYNMYVQDSRLKRGGTV